MSNTEMSKYNIEYMGVVCTGVIWDYKNGNVFYFTKDNKNYTFKQTEDIDCTADTDHIRCVIKEQFLPSLQK